MNIRELDEESRRTGVWPPRRIILRVEREDGDDEPAADGRTAPVKVGEVDLTAPPSAAAPPRPRAPAPLPAPSLSPSVTPSRRRGLPGSRGVTPAPAVSTEDAAFDKWLAEPLPATDAEPEFQPPPAWLPDDVRVRAERRHRRVTRKARTQLFGASAATTLAIGGCAAAVGLIGLSQTESVGGSLGVPSIGVFGTAPKPANNDAADTARPERAERSSARTRPRARRSTARRQRAAAPVTSSSSSSSARSSAPARSSARSRSSAPARTSSPSASRAPARTVVNRPAPPPRRAVNPPPPPPSPPPAPKGPAVVWNAPSSQPVTSAPSQPAASAPSRPVQTAPSRPAPTTSSPAP